MVYRKILTALLLGSVAFSLPFFGGLHDQPKVGSLVRGHCRVNCGLNCERFRQLRLILILFVSIVAEGNRLEVLFQRTETKPQLYWKPLTDEEVGDELAGIFALFIYFASR